MHSRTYSRKIPKSASRWHHRTINKHKRLNYTGENIHVTEHIYLEIYTYIYISMRVCAGGVLRSPLLFTLMYFSSFPIEVCFYWPVGCVTVSSYQGPSCRRLYPPRDHHPLRLPTTGPPPSPSAGQSPLTAPPF